MLKDNKRRFAAIGLTENPDTGWWAKTTERDGYQLRVRAFDWTAAGRISIHVHAHGEVRVLCNWSIGSPLPEGGVAVKESYDLADLAQIAVAIGLLLDTVRDLEAQP